MLPSFHLLKNKETIYITDTQKSRSYDLGLDERMTHWRLNKQINDLKSLEQSIRKRLETEKNTYEIYSSQYGMKCHDLIGRNKDYVLSEIKNRIVENLETDNRIKEIYNFTFPPSGDRKGVRVTFSILSIWGHLETEVFFDV